MNILLISAGLLNTRNGGVPAYVEELIGALLSRGHGVHYLNTSTQNTLRKGVYFDTSTRIDGLVITHFYNLHIFPDFGRGTMDPLNQVKPARDFRKQFEQWVTASHIDLVHIHEFIGFPSEAITVFSDRQIPVMATMHDYYALCPTVKLMLPDGNPCNKNTAELVCRQCCQQGISQIEIKVRDWIKRISAYRGGSWFAGVVWPRLKPLIRKASWWKITEKPYRLRRDLMKSVLRGLDYISGNSQLTADLYRQIGGLTNVTADTTFTRKTIRHEAPVRSRKRTPGEPLKILLLNIRRGPKGLDLLHQELSLLAPESKQNIRIQAWGCSGIESPLVDNRGSYAGDQLDALCAEADVGLVPSVWREAYGFVGAEMLSRGLPLIASQTGAMKEYIEQGVDGLLFNPSKPGDLASVLSQLATDGALLNKLINGAADSWKKFNTFDEHINTLLLQYKKLIAEKCRLKNEIPPGVVPL